MSVRACAAAPHTLLVLQARLKQTFPELNSQWSELLFLPAVRVLQKTNGRCPLQSPMVCFQGPQRCDNLISIKDYCWSQQGQQKTCKVWTIFIHLYSLKYAPVFSVSCLQSNSVNSQSQIPYAGLRDILQCFFAKNRDTEWHCNLSQGCIS